MKKPILFIIIIFLTEFVQAQENSSFNFTLDHIALSVTDVDLASEFVQMF